MSAVRYLPGQRRPQVDAPMPPREMTNDHLLNTIAYAQRRLASLLHEKNRRDMALEIDEQ